MGGLGIHPCLSSWSGARTLFRKPGCFTFWPFGLGLQPKLPVDVTCDFCAAWSRKTTAFACYEGVLGAAASVLGDPIPFTLVAELPKERLNPGWEKTVGDHA